MISFEKLRPVFEYIDLLSNLYSSLRKFSDFRFIEYRWTKARKMNRWSGYDIETDIIIDDLHLFEFFEDNYWKKFFHLHNDHFLSEFENYIDNFKKFHFHWKKNIYKEGKELPVEKAWAQATTLVLKDSNFKVFVFETKSFCEHLKKELFERFLFVPLPLKVENKFYHNFDEVDWNLLQNQLKEA